VVGLTHDLALTKLRAAGLIPHGKHQFRQTDPKGAVYKQDPEAGSDIRPGSPITIYWSDGPAPQPVPDVHGESCVQAKSALLDRHLTGRCIEVFDDTTPKGRVVGTTPAVGTVLPQGTTVVINVSKGRELVLMPNVKRHTVAYAISTLHGLGFTIHVDQPDYSPKAHVFDQSPEPGKMYPKGTLVTLIL